jgi:hypothetical protein
MTTTATENYLRGYIMAEKKKVNQRSVTTLRNWRLSDDEMDDSILGGPPVSKTGNESGKTGKAPMAKMMMRLPARWRWSFSRPT